MDGGCIIDGWMNGWVGEWIDRQWMDGWMMGDGCMMD
jgi:hypothetical protein